MLLNISLSHSKSLKIIEIGTIRKLGSGFLFASIVTMALSCSISEIKRDIGRNRNFFIPLHYVPVKGPRRNVAIPCSMEKLEWCAYTTVKKV